MDNKNVCKHRTNSGEFLEMHSSHLKSTSEEFSQTCSLLIILKEPVGIILYPGHSRENTQRNDYIIKFEYIIKFDYIIRFDYIIKFDENVIGVNLIESYTIFSLIIKT